MGVHFPWEKLLGPLEGQMSAFEVSGGGFIEDWHLTFSAPWKNNDKSTRAPPRNDAGVPDENRAYENPLVSLNWGPAFLTQL